MSNKPPVGCDCQAAALSVAASLDALKMLLETCCAAHTSEQGELILGNGHHEIKIATNYTPSQVFISLDSLDSQVCLGDVDEAGTRLLPDGFVLYADIKSAECQVNWIAKF
jgi:hypothetical protein